MDGQTDQLLAWHPAPSHSPAPAPCIHHRAPGLGAQAGVFWGTDVFSPGSPSMALISSDTFSTPSPGPSSSPPGAGMLAFLLASCTSHPPVTLECFPATRPCLAG